MPIYEYECKKCNLVWEEFSSSFSDHPEECKNGCKERPKRLISKSTFVLKGSGWYRDGYQVGARQ